VNFSPLTPPPSQIIGIHPKGTRYHATGNSIFVATEICTLPIVIVTATEIY
jgi:hypothetical protein